MQIVRYPHPALRHKSKNLRRVDDELRRMVAQMFERMYAARGIGLAANQVALPYRMFVINLTADPNKADQEHVFLNPVLRRPRGSEEAEEGCLSLPELYAPVTRPQRIEINAYDLAGREITLDLDGLFARAVQHEIDHLDGVLFIDHLKPEDRAEAEPAIRKFEDDFNQARARGDIPADPAITRQLLDLEATRT